jgi:hypothetical protein
MEVYRIIKNVQGKFEVETIPEYRKYLDDPTKLGIFLYKEDAEKIRSIEQWKADNGITKQPRNAVSKHISKKTQVKKK